MASSSYRAVKRGFDFAGAALLLGLASPALLITSVAIMIEDGTPVLFRQRRSGAADVPYTIYKFRSMRHDTPNVSSADLLHDTTTRVGRVIRRLSLDELPQLFNVIRGEMSLVGPRPALPSQHHLLGLRRDSGAGNLKPGMTGLAQIQSYDGMPDEVKAAADAAYATTLSLGCDLKILVKTAGYLLRPPPVY